MAGLRDIMVLLTPAPRPLPLWHGLLTFIRPYNAYKGEKLLTLGIRNPLLS